MSSTGGHAESHIAADDHHLAVGLDGNHGRRRIGALERDQGLDPHP